MVAPLDVAVVAGVLAAGYLVVALYAAVQSVRVCRARCITH